MNNLANVTHTLPHRNDIHLARKLWHFSGVMAMFWLYWFCTRETSLKIAFYGTGFLVTLDLLRLRYPSLNRSLTWVFQPVLRESERHRPTGSTFMLIGVSLIVYFFPKPVTLLTLLFFSLADPMAAYIGTRFGKDKLIGSKSLQGTLAAFVVCFVLTLIYCIALNLMMERLVIVAVVCGLIGAVSELVPIANLDDNFIFPVFCAGLLTMAFQLFGGL
jgi:dolichol kinase